MRTSKPLSFAVLFAAAALCACANDPQSKGGPPAPAPTPAPSGSITSTTTVCGPTKKVKIIGISVTGSTAEVEIQPGTTRIGRNKAGVKWILDIDGYDFSPSNGVVFKPSQPPGPTAPVATGDSAEYLWCFDPTAGNLTWNYTINIQTVSTPPVMWTCDPTIVNFGGGGAPTASLKVPCTRVP